MWCLSAAPSRYDQNFPWLCLSSRDYTVATMTNTWDIQKRVIAAGRVEVGGEDEVWKMNRLSLTSHPAFTKQSIQRLGPGVGRIFWGQIAPKSFTMILSWSNGPDTFLAGGTFSI